MTKQSCLISKIILALCLITTCRGRCWGYQPYSSADCPYGYHIIHRTECNVCESNQNGCDIYNYQSASCIECSSMYNPNTSNTNGDHCTIKWWVILLWIIALVAICFLCWFGFHCLKRNRQKRQKNNINLSNNNESQGVMQENIPQDDILLADQNQGPILIPGAPYQEKGIPM